MVTIEQINTRQKKIIAWLKKKQDGIEAMQKLIELIEAKKINNETIDWQHTLATAVNIHTNDNLEE